MKRLITFPMILICLVVTAQIELSTDKLESLVYRFNLKEGNTFDNRTARKIRSIIGSNQFVGLAEIHYSAQLSYFTQALLSTLSDKKFEYFALEIGPNSARNIQCSSSNTDNALENLRRVNQRFGEDDLIKTPLIFTNTIEDGLLMQRAFDEGFKLWGIDQEYEYSYLWHLDKIQAYAPDEPIIDSLFQKINALIGDELFGIGKPKLNRNCSFLEDPTIGEYFDLLSVYKGASQVINHLRASWKIYCESAKNGNNELRATYMKSNFDSLYQIALVNDNIPKVFIKMGNVHLTHGISPLGLYDIGNHIHQLALSNNSGFLSIYQLTSFIDGEPTKGKPGWEGVDIFLNLGRMDSWTLLDLRPFRRRVNSGDLITSEVIRYGLNSYDILIIPPNDWSPKLNY